MKVAIIYICTGEYQQFWNSFYDSSQTHLFVNEDIDIHYFVFTDSHSMIANEHVHLIPIPALGFPLDTLLRYHYILSIQDTLEQYDYILFFNSNITFVQHIHSNELLPKNDFDFTFTIFEFDKNIPNNSYESYKRSTAYIPMDMCKNYYRGGIVIGKKDKFIEMSQIIKKYISTDLDMNYIAIWHDESYLNKYIFEHQPSYMELSANMYMCPYNWIQENSPQIMVDPQMIKVYLADKTKLFDKKIVEKKYHTKKINEDIRDLENKINNLEAEKWYQFGLLSKKQKILTMLRFIIKKLKISCLFKLLLYNKSNTPPPENYR